MHTQEQNQAVENPLSEALLAHRPLIYVATWEEERLIELIRAASHKLHPVPRPLWIWSAAQGFVSGPGQTHDFRDPLAALSFILESSEPATCLMLDLPSFFNHNPALIRALRDIYDALAERNASLVLSHPQNIIPSEIKRELYLVELPLPLLSDRLRQLIRVNLAQIEEKRLPETWISHLSEEMKGLTLNESRDLLREIIHLGSASQEQALDHVRQARAQVLLKENCLQVIHERVDIDQIGGLTRLKNWMRSREKLFTHEAREARIKAPSGILIMGVSGCGKSLAAKVIPSAWNLPLIRLDMNLIMSGAWGTPEAAWDRAMHAVESAAPVVLWIDELENSFGFLNDSITSGNMTVFSAFLTWMQEKPENVFVAATANKIEILPPEMIRKGRFDQLFFVDLPDKKARIEILRIHFLNQGINPYQFDIDHIARLMEGWTAAEIEQLIRSSQIDAFTQERELSFEDLIQNIYNFVPLSKTMAREINTLRSWARDRATAAN